MSFNLVTKIGLPLVAGISIFSIPTAMNETKRSFYSDDEDVSISSIVPEETKIIENQDDSALKTKIVDGYKIDTSNFLETHLNLARYKVIDELNVIEAEYKNLKSATINELNNLTSTVTSVYDPVDQFLPSFIYALTTTLSSSILVNSRSLPIRFFTPLAFAIGSFKVFLPRTFDNTVASIKSWESKEYPELLSFQASVRQFGIDVEQSIVGASESFNQSLINTVRDIRLSLTK